jgi:hypothetical protein
MASLGASASSDGLKSDTRPLLTDNACAVVSTPGVSRQSGEYHIVQKSERARVKVGKDVKTEVSENAYPECHESR